MRPRAPAGGRARPAKDPVRGVPGEALGSTPGMLRPQHELPRQISDAHVDALVALDPITGT